MANLKKNWTDNAYFQNLDQKCLFSNGPKMLISKWTKNGHFQKNWTDNACFQNLDQKCQFSKWAILNGYILEPDIVFTPDFDLCQTHSNVKWNASSRWSLSLYCLMRSSGSMTIGKTRPTLLMEKLMRI